MRQRQGSTRPVFVGMDYHKDSVQVCVLDEAGQVLANQATANDRRAIAAVAGRYGSVRRAALEVGSGAADLAEELVDREGWVTELAHPGYVARMKGSPDKTDFGDARLLADLTRVGYLPRVWLAPARIRELRRLVRYRQQQVAARRATKLRIRGLLRDHRIASPPGVRAWTNRWWGWLMGQVHEALPAGSAFVLERHVAHLSGIAAELADTQEYLRRFTADDPVIARLRTQAGVGEITAWVLRAEIGCFERFDRSKSLARFCGLSPRNASSGARQADAGLIRAGSPLLRTTLIELAHRLCRWDAYWRAFKQHLLARGKAGSLATAAVANRWVRRLHHKMTGQAGNERHDKGSVQGHDNNHDNDAHQETTSAAEAAVSSTRGWA